MQEIKNQKDIEDFENLYPKKDFEYLLLKTELEPNIDMVYKHLINMKHKGIHNENVDIGLHSFILKTDKDRISLIDLLIFLLDNKINGELHISSVKNKIKISEMSTKEIIINSLIEEFKKRKYNITPLSYSEAYEEILQLKDLEWIRNYFENCGYFILRDELVEEYFPTEFKEGKYLTLFEKDPDIFVDIVSDPFYDYEWLAQQQQFDIKNPESYIDELDIVNVYQETHCITKEITLSYLIDEKDKYPKPKIEKPKKVPRNYGIYKLINFLIKTIRNSKTEDNNKISNHEFRLIHDVLAFFEFIPNINSKPEKEKNTTKPENYIRSIYAYHQKK